MKLDRLCIFMLTAVFFQALWSPVIVCARQEAPPDIDTVSVLWQTHDLQRQRDGSYRVTGPDPFLYTQDAIGYSGDIQGFFFTLGLPGDRDRHLLQCYWATARHSFAENYSFHCVLKGRKKVFSMFLPMYFFHTRKRITKIRLDINPKTDQAVSILSFGLVRHVAPWLLENIPEGPGLVRIDDPVVFHSRITPQKVDSVVNVSGSWTSHDMEQIDEKTFRVTGEDPYLESPVLDLDLHGSHGMYLEISGDGHQDSCRMQLFWKTYLMDYPIEKKSYSEGDSYRFWLKMKKSVTGIYLPFDPINPEDVLKRIRLDFDTCENMIFRIQQATLIGGQVGKYRKFLPAQASFHTIAAIPELHNMDIVVPWRQLLFRDRGFWIMFGSVVFAVITAMIFTFAGRINNGRRNRE